MGPSIQSSHMIFLPTMFSASLWAPESDASRTITSLSLYTNSCIFLLPFTAKGARQHPPSSTGLWSWVLSSVGWSRRARKAQSMDGKHPGGVPSSWVCYSVSFSVSPSLWTRGSLQCPSSHALTDTDRGVKSLAVEASRVRLSEIICQEKGPRRMDSMLQCVVTSMQVHISAPSTPHYHQGLQVPCALGLLQDGQTQCPL